MYHEQYNNELSIFNRQNFYNKLIQNTKYKIQNTKYKIQNTKSNRQWFQYFFTNNSFSILNFINIFF